MGLRTLAGMLLAAVALIGLLATRPDYAVFLPQLLQGAVLTVEITLARLPARRRHGRARRARPALRPRRRVRWLATVYVEVFRGTSALVQLFWLFFVLPQFGLTLAPFLVAVLALGLNVGAYGSEVVRGAILGVPRGQWEATTALNMTRAAALRRIILPQAFVAMIPPWGNLFIELLKATSLVSLITLSDLTFRAQTVEPDHVQDRADLHPRADHLPRAVAGADHRHALPREPRHRSAWHGGARDDLGLVLRLRDPAAARPGGRRHHRGDAARLPDRRHPRPGAGGDPHRHPGDRLADLGRSSS